MKERDIIITARVLSMIFTPFYLPLVGILVLFMLTYLNMLPLAYKLLVLLLVYFFTILLPTLLIHYYRKYQGWTSRELGIKDRRAIPYIISIICYFLCYYVMIVFHIPTFMAEIVVAALFIQIACAIVNMWWKISTHAAAIGGLGGGVLGLSFLFNFNPTGWLCVIFLLGGLVGSSRMVLRQHSLGEVTGGFALGFFVSFVTFILPPMFV